MSPGPSSPWRRAGGSGGSSGGSRLQNILLVIILFLCSNFAGHYYPFLWSPAARASAVQSLLATRQHLPDIRTGRGERGGVGDERNSGGSMILSEEGRRSIMALAAADGLREGEISAQRLGGGLGGTNGAGGGVPRRPWQSRFVQDVRIDVGGEAMCADIVPDEFRESTDRMPPVTSLLDLLRPNERFLAFLPRHGLGNSLRGFVSAFVYASLAGRRLVRLHAGEHARVYDLLCQAYGCSSDAVGQPGGVDRGGEEDGSGGDGGDGEGEDGEVGGGGERSVGGGGGGDGRDGGEAGAREGGGGVWEGRGARRGLKGDGGAEGAVEVVKSASEGRSGTGVELLRKFAMLRPIYFLERYQNVQTIAASLQSDYPVLATRSGTLFDLFWHRSDRLRSCVFAAFHCSSVWRHPQHPPFHARRPPRQQ
ncbi:unnamed protein product [Closterium sp. NIES-65]|nr:unnamed protein product [Closterium sp. NIES-65]